MNNYHLDLSLELAMKWASARGADVTPEEVVATADVFATWYEGRRS